MTNAFRPKRHTFRSFPSILLSTISSKAGTRLLFAAAMAFTLACLFVSLKTEARTSTACECNRNAPDIIHARWMPNSTLSVMLRRGDFSPAEAAAFRESIRLWQAVLPASGTGINLQMGGEIAGNNCTGCIIVKRKADLRGTFAALSLLSTQGDLYSKAIINIKADVHKTELLRMLLTHELGHAFGLDDCAECAGNTTVMNSVNKYSFGAFSFFAPRSKMALAPTPCDVARVSAGYAGAAHALAAAARSVSFVNTQERAQAKSLSAAAPPLSRAPMETGARHHASRDLSQSQRSVKITQLALMDALVRRD